MTLGKAVVETFSDGETKVEIKENVSGADVCEIVASDLIERAKQFLFGRQTAYRAIFMQGPVSDIVLADLAKFCRANETTFHPDPRMAAQLDGRREVFLRIQQHLKLTPDELWKLYQSK